MSNLFRLTEAQLARLQPFCARAMASPGSLVGAC